MTQGEAPVLVGFGASLRWLGRSPGETILSAADALARFGPLALSPLYDSPAWPDPSAPPYVNAVGRWDTALSPEAALAALLGTEAAFGRRRSVPNAPRTLDLDLLAHGRTVCATDTLTLPHPRLAERDFVLRPLLDVAPSWQHPQTGAGAAKMLARLGPSAATRRPPCNAGGGP